MMLLRNKEEQPGDSLKHKEVDVVIGRQSRVGGAAMLPDCAMEMWTMGGRHTRGEVYHSTP